MGFGALEDLMPIEPIIDRHYLARHLENLLLTPSPTGMTDLAVGYVCSELENLRIPYELTRRGAIRADIKGHQPSPDRAIVTHLDTLGAIVKSIQPNGRPTIAPVGHWSARFAEGARCTIFADDGKTFRGTILPLKASGHTFGDGIDTQPISWSNLEIRLDEKVLTDKGAAGLGIHVGDMVAIDSQPEFSPNGFVNARHLDDKAGVAAVLAMAKAMRDQNITPRLDCHLLFTIAEEVGSGASAVLHGDVAELISVDNGTIAPGQNTAEYGVTIAMQDSSGPFDWHLTRHLLGICKAHRIAHSRDVFNHYRSDAASAVEAGNDIRTALVCFALDSSHGYERSHLDSLEAVARLLALYAQTPELFRRDAEVIGPAGDLPSAEVADALLADAADG
jgi:peptidase M42 family hydrolase